MIAFSGKLFSHTFSTGERSVTENSIVRTIGNGTASRRKSFQESWARTADYF